MKFIFVILLMIFSCLHCFAQQGNKWITGNGNIVDFRSTPSISYLQCDSFDNGFYALGHSMICDSGRIIFANTGIISIRSCENILENGTPSLDEHFAIASGSNGYFIQQSIIIPKKENQHYVFYTSISNSVYDNSQNGGEFYFDEFFYDIVDMNANGGNGKVIERKKPLILNGRVSGNSLQAVKHANGRDWWVVKPNDKHHLFYTFLVTSDKIEVPFEQDMQGPDFISNNWGQSNFSQDGQYYSLTQNGNEFIQINTFDRCTGKMSKYRSVPPPIDTNWYYDPILQKDTFELISAGTGVCFSPNNQFLYIVTPISVWQYDINTEEMINLNTDTFYNGALNVTAYNAPDGRIYTGNWNGTNYGLSYIEFPDKKGTAAHLCQICLPTILTTTTPPNMPNYELGALKGSSCDTIRPPVVNTAIKFYPNPTSDNLTIELTANTKKAQVIIYNMLGEVTLSLTNGQIKNDKIWISVSHLARAFYSIKVITDGNKYIGKFVKE